jgi:hypothetical protein
VERISVVEIKKGKEWGEGSEKLIVEFRCFFFVGLPTCTLSPQRGFTISAIIASFFGLCLKKKKMRKMILLFCSFFFFGKLRNESCLFQFKCG